MHMPSLSQAEQGAVLQVFILTAILGEPTQANTTLGQSYDWPRCTFDHEMSLTKTRFRGLPSGLGKNGTCTTNEG